MKKADKQQEEKYREAGVEGNDQNKAFSNDGRNNSRETLGNAERSERGTTEFETDHDIKIVDEKPDCLTLSENGKETDAGRGQTEFEEDKENQ